MDKPSCINIVSCKGTGASEKPSAQREIVKPLKTKCKIWNDDCLSRMQKLQESSVDFLFADLPYGVTKNPWDSIIPFVPLWHEINRVAKENAAIVMTAKGLFAAKLMLSNARNFRYDMVWAKPQATGHLSVNYRPLAAHELILVFYRKQPTYNPQITEGHKKKVSLARHKRGCQKNQSPCYGRADVFSDYCSTTRQPRSVLTFSSDKQRCSIHPTQKPLALLEYLIKTFTQEGDSVFDPCMGSGTTGVAAILNNRRFLGIEKDSAMFELAQRRLEYAARTGSDVRTSRPDKQVWRADASGSCEALNSLAA